MKMRLLKCMYDRSFLAFEKSLKYDSRFHSCINFMPWWLSPSCASNTLHTGTSHHGHMIFSHMTFCICIIFIFKTSEGLEFLSFFITEPAYRSIVTDIEVLKFVAEDTGLGKYLCRGYRKNCSGHKTCSRIRVLY